MSQTLNVAIAVVGIDIGKNSFHIVGHDERGAIVLRRPAPAGRPSSTLVGSDRRLHVDHIVRTTLARRGAGVCPEAAEFPRRERDARL